MNFGNKIITWYDRSLKLWTAVYHDQYDDQVGNAGYGVTKKDAVDDLAYQNKGME